MVGRGHPLHPQKPKKPHKKIVRRESNSSIGSQSHHRGSTPPLELEEKFSDGQYEDLPQDQQDESQGQGHGQYHPRQRSDPNHHPRKQKQKHPGHSKLSDGSFKTRLGRKPRKVSSLKNEDSTLLPERKPSKMAIHGPEPSREIIRVESKTSLFPVKPSAQSLARSVVSSKDMVNAATSAVRPSIATSDMHPIVEESVENVQPKENEEEDNRKDGYSGDFKPTKGTGEGEEDIEESRNVWSIEAFEPTPDRKYATKLATAISPFMNVAAIFGRFPLTWSCKKQGNVVFKFNFNSFPAIAFMVMGVLTLLLFMLTFFNLVGLMMNKPASPDVGNKRSRLIRSEEIAVFKRNVVPLIIFMTNLIHLVLAQAAFFFKRDYIARYFSYWGEVVELLRLDVANKLKSEMQKQMVILMLMFGLVLGFHYCEYFSATNGGAAAVGILLARGFDSAVHLKEDFWKYRYMGAFVFSYVYVSSKFYMIYFFFRCRLLKNLFVVWNRRFNICVNGAPGIARRMIRSTRAYLFKDHIVTLNLIEGANHEFVLILESYLLCAMISMVMEMYHLVRAVGGSEFDENRQFDFIVLLFYLVYDFYIFFTACLEGGYIPEQAKVAFGIVKRKGMMTNRADQELWFMLSMRISFGGCSGVQGVGITAGDYVYITKTFILLAIGAMTSHFIIIYQFEMPLAQTVVSDPYFTEINMTEVLARVEGTRRLI